MEETFGMGSFRSRQQVMAFEGALRRSGIRCQIISTPRDVTVGCGLSVRFELSDAEGVLAAYQRARPGNLIGFYRVTRSQGGRPKVTPL